MVAGRGVRLVREGNAAGSRENVLRSPAPRAVLSTGVSDGKGEDA